MAAVDPRATPATSRQAQLQYWALWGLAGLAIVGLLARIALDVQVSNLERDAVAKQQFVNQTVAVSRLNGQLVQLLANVAASTGDGDIERLLNEQGIQFQASPKR